MKNVILSDAKRILVEEIEKREERLGLLNKSTAESIQVGWDSVGVLSALDPRTSIWTRNGACCYVLWGLST